MSKITSKFTTIAVVGFRHCVNAQNSNPSAHGAVCLLQARRNAHGEIVGREVNSNGRHSETGRPFPLPADRLAQWQRIG